MENSCNFKDNFYIASIGKSREQRMWNKIEQIEPILKDLENYKIEIKKIQLSDNSIGSEVAEALSLKIKNLENLTHANFDNIFVSRVKEELPKALYFLVESLHNKNIFHLNLSDNAFGPIGVKSIENYISSNSSLKELYVENCGLGPEGAEHLADILSSNKNLNLKKIRIGRNRLENKGATAFGKYFKLIGNKSLTSFVAFQNGIKEEGMKNLLAGLVIDDESTEYKLQCLKLNDNFIEGDGFTALINLLQENKLLNKLEILDVSDCKIGSENSINLFNSISKSNSIKEIYCNYNDIEDSESQNAIFKHLQLNLKHKLDKLEIKGNEIKKSVFKKLKTNENTEYVDCYSESEMDIDELEDLMSNLNIKK